MNKRIRDLEKQATEIVKCGLNGSSTTESFSRKKFAELIIQNCIDVLKNTIEMQCQTESEKFGCNCGIMDIQDYFGFVEPGHVTICLE